MSFGENLQFLRNHKGYNQKQLANLLGTSQQHISQLENSIREPNLQDLKQLSEIFQLPIDLLLTNSCSEYSVLNLNAELWFLLLSLTWDNKLLMKDLLSLICEKSLPSL